MRRSLILLVALAAPARADELAITNVHMTHGILGPTRTDKRVIPGDSVYVSFTIEGLTTAADGKAKYSTALEIVGDDGKVIFKQAGKPQEIVNTLGGNQAPAYAQLDVGLNQAPGEFTMKLIVTDLTTNKSQTLSHKGTIQPKGFGLVRVTTSADPANTVPSGLLGPGQSMFVNALVVGFERDPGTKQPKLALELRVLDESGKPTLPAPLTGMVEKGIAPTELGVPVQFHVSLNRPGKFTVELKATDKVSGKTDTRSFPINVHQPEGK
jgi:hypothetical protein